MMRAAILAGLAGLFVSLGCGGAENFDFSYRCYTPGGDLRVIDVSDPTDPVVVRLFETVYPGFSVAVVGGMAYSFFAGLASIDVSDPAADPVEIGYLTAPIFRNLEIIDGLAYAATNRPTAAYEDLFGSPPALRVFDVSDPEIPEEIGYLGLEEDIEVLDIDVEGGIAYVAVRPCPEQRLESTPSYCPNRTGTDGVAVSSSTTFTSAAANFTVDDVGHSIIIAGAGEDQCQRPNPPASCTVEDLSTTILTVTGESSVVLADAPLTSANPATWEIGGGPYLLIIDVSTPEIPVKIPVQIGYFGDIGPVRGVEVVDGLAYLSSLTSRIVSGERRAKYRAGLWVFDVADPENPEEIGFRFAQGNSSEGPDGIVVSGDLAYMTSFFSRKGSLRVFDVSDPTDPAQLSSLVLGEDVRVWDLAVGGGIAYAAASSGLLLIDVSDPENPVEVGALPAATPDGPRLGVSVLSGLVYDVGWADPSAARFWECPTDASHIECSSYATPLPAECTPSG